MLGTLNQLAGFAIERQILKQIQARYAVVPTAAIRTEGTHGPRMEGGGNGARLPDAQAFGQGLRGWLEVKAKSAPNLWRNYSRYEHGFDENAIQDYRRVQATSGLAVNILVCEAQPGRLVMATLDTLDTVGNPKRHGGPMIHYDARAFLLVGTCDFPDGGVCRMVVDWDWEAVNGFLGQVAFEFAAAEIRT